MKISKKIEVTTNAVDLIRELAAKYPKIGAIVVRSEAAVVIDHSDLRTQSHDFEDADTAYDLEAMSIGWLASR